MNDDIVAKIHKIADGLPVTITRDENGKPKVTYSTEWKTGGTEPVEDEDGNVVDYKKNYKKQSLTDKQRADIDAYIKTLE